MQLNASNAYSPDASKTQPKSTAAFSLYDVTDGISLLNPGSNWQIASSQATLNKTESVRLQLNHTYELRALATGLAGGTLTITYEEVSIATYGTRNKLVGGVRVREERLQAAAQAPVTIRRYSYQNPATGFSSGLLVNSAPPLYSRKQISRVEGKGDLNCPRFLGEVCVAKSTIDITYTIVSSNSLGELEGTDQVVGYTAVAVVDSTATGQTSGRTLSTYSFAEESAYNQTPFPPKVLVPWKRGNLLTQRIYTTTKSGKNGLALVSKVVHTYTTLDSVTFRGLIVAVSSIIAPSQLFSAYDGNVVPFAYLTTRQRSGWQPITKTQHYQYAPGDTSAYQVTTTFYHYGNVVHCQPTLVETTLPSGQRQQVRSHYAADYNLTQVRSTSNSPARALRDLVDRHAVADLVEQTTTRVTPTDTLVTASSLTLSQLLAPGVVVPMRQLGFNAAHPLPWHTFQPARLLAGHFRTDPHYETRVVFDRYNAQRQLTQAHLVSGTPLAYLWDTSAGQPLAKAMNAPMGQVAVTSFEPGAPGRWAYDSHVGSGQHLVAGQAHSGRWAYRLATNWAVSRDSLPAGDYVLTCWYQGSSLPLAHRGSTSLGTFQVVSSGPGGWHQARLTLHLPAVGDVRLDAPVTTTILVDDVVLQPVGAQVNAYTYDALRGMTSQTDPTGRTTFYEYDGLGRLVRTRDEQGRILSQQQYHYAGK